MVKNTGWWFFLIIFLSVGLVSITCDASRIHIFGDSNVLHSFMNDPREFPGQMVYRYDETLIHKELGLSMPSVLNAFVSKTMHGMSKEGFLNIKEYGVEENESAVFVFGCVDIYHHITKQRDEKFRNLEDILDSLVNNYMRCIIKNRNQYERLFCIIVSVLPPYHQIPGSLEDKVDITFKLNKKLQKACSECDIDYLDVHHLYVTEDGFLNPLLGNNHHVNAIHNYPIQKKLIELLVDKNFGSP